MFAWLSPVNLFVQRWVKINSNFALFALPHTSASVWVEHTSDWNVIYETLLNVVNVFRLQLQHALIHSP